MHVLLVLEQRAVQRRDGVLRFLGAQGFRRDVLGQQQLQPVDQFAGRRLLLQAGHVAQVEEHFQRFLEQLVLEDREMHADDALHGLLVRELDVVEEAAAQEGVGQFLLVVRGDDDQRPVPGLDGAMQLVAVEFHAVEFAQQVVGNSMSALSISSISTTDGCSHSKACHSTPCTM
jgi:hypothetical protein